jgi:hypothetical protein
MTQKRSWKSSFIVMSALSLALLPGCSDSSSSNGGPVLTTNISGQVTAAPVNNSIVEVYGIKLSTRALTFIGSVTTNASGQYAINITGAGPFLVLSRGGSFVDEATGNTSNLGLPALPTALDTPRTRALEGVIASGVNGNVTLNITPLTTFASRRLAVQFLTLATAYDPANVLSVNQSVAQEFGLGSTTDPRAVVPVDFTDASNGAFIAANPTDPTVQLGAILSGLSQLAVDLGVADPMAVIEALAQDFSDGTFNGVTGNMAIAAGNNTLPQNAGTTSLAASITNFLNNNPRNNSGTNSAANNALVTAVNTLDVSPGGNTAPFFDAVANQMLLINSGTANVTVMNVSPGALAAESTQAVVVSAVSSNPTILPNPTVSGSGATRTLGVSPGALGGTVTVTVTAMDDGGTANNGMDTFIRSFQVTIIVPNQAPTFDMIQDQTVNEDSGQSTVMISKLSPVDIGQTISSVTAVSNNTALIPNPTITGSGFSRTLTFAPLADAFGAATITVTVQDDGGLANSGINTTTQTFMITVTPINEAPTFDMIGNQNVAQNAAQQTIIITGVTGGPANESQTVNFTATSNAMAIVPDPMITGSGATRTLTYTPVAAASGTVTITVTAMDTDGMLNGGVDMLQRTFDIAVIVPAGNATVATVVPDKASNAGGTVVRVSTTMFQEDFTMTAPTATVGGVAVIVNSVNSTTIDVTIPSGLGVAAQAIQVNSPTDSATFSTFELVSPIQSGDVIINEVLYDPGTGDANGDTMVNATEDEFVELVNVRSSTVDLTGFQITTLGGTVHVFPNPTTVPANGSIVVFGGGTPTGFAALHANGAAQTATMPSAGGLNITDAGDTVTLLDLMMATSNQVTFGASTSGVSTNRMMDADGQAALVLHTAVAGAIGNFSPARQVNGLLHALPPTIDAVVPAAGVVTGGTTITVTTSNFGDFTMSAPTVTLGATPVTAMTVMTSSFTFNVPMGLPLGMATLNISNALGSANFTTFQIVAAAALNDLFINEFFADPNGAGGIVDANGDQVLDSGDDEFIEIVNTLGTPIDISNFTFVDDTITRHTFPNPTVIPAGGSLVLFGGGSPTNFPGAQTSGAAQVATGGLIGLNNTGDTFFINDVGAVTITTVTYTSATAGLSSNRDPDGSPMANFMDHSAVAGSVGPVSPGKKVDGSSFP